MILKTNKHVSAEATTNHIGALIEGDSPKEIKLQIMTPNMRYNQTHEMSIDEVLDLAGALVLAVEGWQDTAEKIHLIQDYPWHKRINEIKEKILRIRRKN